MKMTHYYFVLTFAVCVKKNDKEGRGSDKERELSVIMEELPGVFSRTSGLINIVLQVNCSFLTFLESLPFFVITDVIDLGPKQTRAVHISREK